MASGSVVHPDQRSQLSFQEKRELVCNIARWPKDACETLTSSFTRRDLLQIVCAEMGGQDRRYSGYTKSQLIKQLLKVFSHKSTGLKKRKRLEQVEEELVSSESDGEQVNVQLCQNAACRASLSPDDDFCRRCSCCICHFYDENKDPSLWLTCGSDDLTEDNFCTLTCHLICALKDKRSGIVNSGACANLDGSFYCVACGKANELMRTCRKQLLIAKEARRVDVLCLRVLLAHKILSGTVQYYEIYKMIDIALQRLKNELGPLDLVYTKMARGIVNRLSCGAEVQKMCASAVQAFDSEFSGDCPGYQQMEEAPSCGVHVGECSTTSADMVFDYPKNSTGCVLFLRPSTLEDYPDEYRFLTFKQEKRCRIEYLSPSTEYLCKVHFFSPAAGLGTEKAGWIKEISFTTASDTNDETETNSLIHITPPVTLIKNDNTKLPPAEHKSTQQNPAKDIDKNKNDRVCSPPLTTDEAVAGVTNDGSFSPSTPCKSNEMQDVRGSKIREEESAYEYSVRVIKKLEQERVIEESFRVKFLTWFSLRASAKERRVVNAFVDTLNDHPPNLAEQLKHAFMDEISLEQKSGSECGMCSRGSH
ncbi:Protein VERNALIZATION INSENSITIVE 3 [Linum perenne]